MPPETVLNDIHAKLEKIVNWQAAHDEAHKSLVRDVAELRTTVYGNGKPGIRDTIMGVAAKCAASTCGGWKASALRIFEGAASNGLLAFIIWLLFIYKVH